MERKLEQLPPPNSLNRLADEAVSMMGLEINPINESPYQEETSVQQELRSVLHHTCLMMGNVHHFDETASLPKDVFSPEQLVEMGVPESATHISVEAYERTDHSIYYEDSGEESGNFTLMLTERDRYYGSENPVEPIRGSITLKSTKGNLSVGFVVPSRHFEKDDGFSRDEDELMPPKFIQEVHDASDGIKADQIFLDFLKDCNPDLKDSFAMLQPIFYDSKNTNDTLLNKWAQMSDLEAAAITNLYSSLYG